MRVLPGGDGERVQMPLGVRRYGEAISRRGRWREPSGRLHRAFLVRLGRFAVGVLLDPPVDRFGRS
ncbi:hypothetical protein [Streptomyces sp. Agncl-13]|uniref:hypothetical protein n=1 Tax=Streptomyces sp. Agncl-13 TaxID=3400628 RepID=UPI003A84825A